MRFLPKLKSHLFSFLFFVICFLLFVPQAHAQTPTPVPFIFGTDPTTGDFVIKALGGAVKMRIDSAGNLDVPIKGIAGGGGGNLVPNGSFEYNTAGTGETIGTTNSWTKDFQTTCGASCTYKTEGGSFYGGSKSYSMKPTTAGPTASIASDVFQVVPNSTLKGVLDINCDINITSGITVSVIYYTGDFTTTVYGSRSGTATTIYSGGCTAGTTWANKSLEFTVPSNCSASGGGATATATCTRARVLIARDSTDPTATLFLDNVSVAPPSGSSTLSAAGISAGAFGSNTGGGNYSFGGNVGIGTTAPAAKLDIAGVVSTISNTVGNISIIPAGNLILTQGNFGIGTTGPSGNLDVSSTGITHTLVQTTGVAPNYAYQDFKTPTAWLQIGVDRPAGGALVAGGLANASVITTANATPLQFGIQNAAKVTIDTSGNVGIGTTGPTHKLHLNDGGANQLAMRVQGGTGNTLNAWTGIGLSGEAANTKAGILFQSLGTSYSRGNLIFANNNSVDQTNVSPADAIMTLTPSGNVGIGTTNPATALQVNGTITANFPGSSYNYAAVSAFTNGAVSYFSSDRRLKTNIKDIEDGLSIVNQLKPSTFNLKADNYAASGFIAQDVLGLVPGAATVVPDDGYLMFNVNGIVAYIAKAVQELDLRTKGIETSGQGDLIIGGNVGIGTISPQGKLDVAGTAYVTSGAWSGSDIRWKKNIAPLRDSLGKVLQLQGVSFLWNKEAYPDKGFIDGAQIGLVAQDVEKVIPEVVSTNTEGYKSLSYEKLTAVLIEAIKELKQENEQLRLRIATLEAR